MAHYDIFSAQLAMKHPAYGHALWEPSPTELYAAVEVGDVGFIREGRFHRLFNALLPADHPSHNLGVPEYHEPLIPSLSVHIVSAILSPSHYCSAGIDVVTGGSDIWASGPDDFSQVSFLCRSNRVGAVLSLPVRAQRQDTLARGDFARWIVKHIDTWLAFARQLGLGIEHMEEIVLVTGRDCSKSWTNVAFLGYQVDAQVSVGVNIVQGLEGSIEWQSLPGRIRGAVLNEGPGGRNLQENQCIFIRGFRVARTFKIFPEHVKAAAEKPDGDEADSGPEPDRELISMPTATKAPLHSLFEYITERAPECDMFLVHDTDLVLIGENYDSNPNGLKICLERSNAKIHKVSWDSSPDRAADKKVIQVAMLSNLSHEHKQPRLGLGYHHLPNLLEDRQVPEDSYGSKRRPQQGLQGRSDDAGPSMEFVQGHRPFDAYDPFEVPPSNVASYCQIPGCRNKAYYNYAEQEQTAYCGHVHELEAMTTGELLRNV